jgi:fatty acid desaturase
VTGRREQGPPARVDASLLRELARPRPGAWLLAAAVDWSVVAATFALVAWIDHPVGYLLALVPLGSRQQALGALFHDASHRLLLRHRLGNDLLGNLLSAWPLGLTLGGYRRYHFAHHRHLGTDADPEITHRRSLPQWDLPAAPHRTAAHFALDLLGGGLPHLAAAGGLTRPTSPREAVGLVAFWIVVLLVALKLHLLWIPLLWVASIATVFWSGVRLRIWTEHLGTTDTHRISVPGWLGHLIMPHSIGHHWEHHHWPSVPFSNLPRLRAALPPGEGGAPPVLDLFTLLGAFLRSVPLASGRIGVTIGREGALPDAPADRGPRPEGSASLRSRLLLSMTGHVVAPLLLGVLLYLTCRPVLPGALAWFPAGGALVGRVPAWVVQVAPDALWAHALTALVALLWRDRPGPARRAWLAAAVFVIVGWELGQWVKITPGTFDPWDLLFSVAASALAVLLCPGQPPGDLDHAP